MAQADTAQATTLYVNQVSWCSNSGPGTEAIPYCTIQAAANVVDPGQIVVIETTGNAEYTQPCNRDRYRDMPRGSRGRRAAAADTGGSSQTSQRPVVAGTTTAPNVTLRADPQVTSSGIVPDSASFTISAGTDDWELTSGTLALATAASWASARISAGIISTRGQARIRRRLPRPTCSVARRLRPPPSRWADGTSIPKEATVQFRSGHAASNKALAMPGSDGLVDFYNGSSGPIDLIVDTFGLDVKDVSGDTYTPDGPVRVLSETPVGLPSRRRLLDTFTGTGTGGVIAKIGPKQTVKLQISGKNGIPASGISAVAVNLTASGASVGGFIEGYPDGVTRPTAVSLGYGYRAAIANAAIIPVGSDGAIDLYSGGSSGVDLIVDLTGSCYQYPSLP